MKMTANLSAQEKKDMRTLWWRSCLINGSMQAIKRQAMGFTYSLLPLLDRYYKGDKNQISEAMQRHDVYINTHACAGTFLLGLTAALEKSKSEGKDVDGSVITNIKTSLMGPLAGIGDSIFHVTLRVIGAGIGIAYAQQGNILGAIIFLAIYGGAFLGLKYPLIVSGYTLGTTYLKELFEKGWIKSITKAASVLGLTMVGCLASSLITIKTSLVLNISGAEVSLQNMFDQIIPNAFALITLFCVYKLIKKKVSVTKIVMGMLALGIVLAFFKIV